MFQWKLKHTKLRVFKSFIPCYFKEFIQVIKRSELERFQLLIHSSKMRRFLVQGFSWLIASNRASSIVEMILPLFVWMKIMLIWELKWDSKLDLKYSKVRLLDANTVKISLTSWLGKTHSNFKTSYSGSDLRSSWLTRLTSFINLTHRKHCIILILDWLHLPLSLSSCSTWSVYCC